MKQGEKELGVVVSVDSDEAVVGMYNVTNGASYFIDGEEINGIKVGAYAILKQGRNRIVVTVLSKNFFKKFLKPTSILKCVGLRVYERGHFKLHRFRGSERR